MKYKAEGRPITALEVQLALDRFRASQKYVYKLPEGTEDKRALEATINLAYDFLADIMREHGIDNIEDMISFELGYTNKWKD